MGFKETVATSDPVPGWDFTLVSEGDEGRVFACTPPDDWIREAAYFRFVDQDTPGASPFANWITAEENFLIVWTQFGINNGVPPEQ